MMSLFGKSVTWIVASVFGLVFAVGAAVIYGGSGSDKGTVVSPLWPPHLQPQLPPDLPPHHVLPPVVPEVNTGLVLLPIVLGILLFASRQLLTKRAVQNR
jgi:hypothetical protein